MSLLPYAYIQKTMTNYTLVHMTSRDREDVVEGYVVKDSLTIGPEELHHRLGRRRVTVELLEEQD
jgi:hypothetical protein